MARRKKAEAAVTDDTPIPEETVTEPKAAPESPPVEPKPDIFDEQIALRQQEAAKAIVQDVADATKLPESEPLANGFAAKHAPGHIANPSSKRRESHVAAVRKLPGTLTVMAGDLAVRLIDAGDNRMGIGIRVEAPEGRKLTEDEIAIIRKHVKGEEGEQTGFTWDRDNQMWHKHIVRENEFEDQVPPSRPVAIRLDAERRVEQLAEALRQHSADPAGYVEMIRQRREQAAEAGRIPD